MAEKREKPHWEGKHYSFFQNTECEYFPCHRVADPARFSCLFCYCPLYMLGPDCGGNFRYTEKGIKDCTNCAIPHLPENYGRITGKYKEIAAAMRQPKSVHPEKRMADEIPGKGGSTAEQGPEKTDAAMEAVNRNLSQTGKGSRSFGRIVMMACTERGFDTMRRAAKALAERLTEAEILQTGRCAHVSGYEDGPRLSEATEKWFYEADALIFFAATGIAVRCIAPFAQDKFKDPAVLVMDENGRFAISLMSGHAGGANRLCGMLAEAVGAQPVITTATDGRGLFAVDVFAAENGLSISDRTIAKQVSARILAGEKLKIFFEGEPDCFDASVSGQSASAEGTWNEKASDENGSDESTSDENGSDESASDENGSDESTSDENGSDESASDENGSDEKASYESPCRNSPAAEVLSKYGGGICLTSDRADADVIVSCRRQSTDRENALYLIPRTVTLGIGCRRGIAEEAVRRAVLQTLHKAGVFRQALSGIASIDLKKEEAGLHAFAQEWELQLTFYTADELSRVPGNFSSSDFVRSITGVDCVCERSAVRLALDHAGARDFAEMKEKVGLQTSDVPQENGGPQFEKTVFLLQKKQSLDSVTTALAVKAGNDR